MLAMLPWNAEPEVRSIIRSGTVAYELLRPIDLYSLWYCRAVAGRTAPTLLKGIPIVLFSTLLMSLIGLGQWSLQLPASGAAAGAFVLAMASPCCNSLSRCWSTSACSGASVATV